jgi:multiple sugar transport system substrate-binding protein
MKNTPSQSRNRARVLAGSLAALVLLGGLSAWLLRTRAGDPADAATQRASGAVAAAPAASSPIAGKRIVLLTSTSLVRSTEAAARWFQEETGAIVQVKVVSYEHLAAAIESDLGASAPELDVIVTFYTDVARLVERGALMDLTDFIASQREVLQPEDFISSLYDAYSLYKGRRWGLPFDGDTHVLFYRKSLLAKYGLQPPDTWDDYLRVARTITEGEKERGVYGAAIMGHPAPVLIISSYMNRLATHGGQLLDQQGRPALDSPEALAALQALLAHAQYALPTPVETDFDASRLAFLSGRVAMVEQWTDIGIMAEDVQQSTIRGDWGAVQMPLGTGAHARRASALNAGFAIAVAARAREPEAARAFVAFATRPDISLKLNLTNGGCDPTRRSALQSEEYQRFAPEVSAAKRASLEHTVALPTLPSTPELLDALSKSLVSALEGKATAEQALAEAQAAWLAILALPAGAAPAVE